MRDRGIVGSNASRKAVVNIQKILFACMILLTIAAAISVTLLAPRMLNSAVFSEYGWQGGKPMLTYNGLLLLFGGFAGWKLRNTVEGRLLISWVAMLWTLTTVHIVEGLEDIPVLSLLSYTLYSMGIHAFHIPLAAMVALWLSPSTGLNSLEGERGFLSIGWDPVINERLSKLISAVVLVAILLANGIVSQISHHNELRPITDGDLELRKTLNSLEQGSVVYTENNHWGYLFDHERSFQTTSFPSLGLVQVQSSIQSSATSGIVNDNITRIQQLGINYAISSPMGTIGWKLAESRYWSVIKDIEGSRLWKFNPNGNSIQSTLAPVIDSTCNENCEMRQDPWRDNRFTKIDEMNQDYRAFIEEGKNTQLGFALARTVFTQSNTCIFFESIGDLDSFTIQVGSTSHTVNATTAGWHNSCFILNNTTNDLQISLEWADSTESESWLNPTGLSGRGDRIIDVSGLRLHWIEIDI